MKIGGYSGGVLNKAEDAFPVVSSLGASDYDDDDDVGILDIGSGLTGKRQGNDEVTGWVIECALFGGMWGGGKFGLERQ